MKTRIIFCLSVFFLFTLSSKSQWNPCLGIEGGNINDIILHDTSLYILAGGAGVFKKGIHEQAWSENIRSGAFYRIRTTDEALFCLGYYSFYRSLDGGITWGQLDLEYTVDNMETSDSVVFITTEMEVLKSSDLGNTWTDINPFPNLDSYELHFHANDGWIICTDDNGDSLSYSSNNGDSWIKIPVIDSVGYIMDAFIAGNELWLSYRKKGSNTQYMINAYNMDFGSWRAMYDSLPPTTYPNAFFMTDGLLRCGTNRGFYHLDPQDSTWISENNDGLENKYINAVCLIGDSICAATPSGPFLNPDNSGWIPDYNNLHQRVVTQVFKNGNRLFALTGDRIYFSDSVEAGFEIMNTQGLGTAYEILVTDSVWYAASTNGFLVSADSGQTWVSHSEGLGGRSVYNITLNSEYYFCKKANSGVFRTRKDSIAWESVPNDLNDANVWGLSSLNDVVFASVYMQGVFRSEDNGTTFQHVTESETNTPVLHLEDQALYMLKDWGPVLSTSGDCTQWDTYLSNFISYTMLASMDISNENGSLIIGGGIVDITLEAYYLQYFEDPENGYGIDIIDNLPYCSYPFINTVYNDHGRLFACPNSNGLYYRDDFYVSVNDNLSDKKTSGDDIKIYPNPATERIFVQNLEDNEIITVRIFNSQGQLMQSGDYKFDYIDVSNLKAGLYIAEIQSCQSMCRKKLIIK
jgi:photosystem II stability/assembly factor-like uncharacterized protein